jgi:hypothetical protein
MEADEGLAFLNHGEMPYSLTITQKSYEDYLKYIKITIKMSN